MEKVSWNIEEMLSVEENIIFKCEISDENKNDTYKVYLTNYRIIWIMGEFVDCRLLRFISKYGVYVGYEDYQEPDDLGTGEYGIYFGDTAGYTSLWFYAEDVWKEFYEELSRAILDAN